jgi:putative GTP pyrophosphokinase
MATPGPLVHSTTTQDTEITVSAAELREMRDGLQRFLMEYRFGLQEVETKIGILRDEFLLTHDYNPIEHVSSRVKSPDSLVEKVQRKGVEADFASIRRSITDIAGIRVTCSFVADVYRLFDLLIAQDDVRLIQVKDYIAAPKPNGYKSLHAIIEVPVFLSTGRIEVPVEVQFRTIAMDFWASLEHKIYYKYATHVPDELLESLKDAADTAAELDERMERLHREIRGNGGARAVVPQTAAASMRPYLTIAPAASVLPVPPTVTAATTTEHPAEPTPVTATAPPVQPAADSTTTDPVDDPTAVHARPI